MAASPGLAISTCPAALARSMAAADRGAHRIQRQSHQPFRLAGVDLRQIGIIKPGQVHRGLRKEPAHHRQHLVPNVIPGVLDRQCQSFPVTVEIMLQDLDEELLLSTRDIIIQRSVLHPNRWWRCRAAARPNSRAVKTALRPPPGYVRGFRYQAGAFFYLQVGRILYRITLRVKSFRLPGYRRLAGIGFAEIAGSQRGATDPVLCSTCLGYFNLTDQVRVGIVGGMIDILEAQRRAGQGNFDLAPPQSFPANLPQHKIQHRDIIFESSTRVEIRLDVHAADK